MKNNMKTTNKDPFIVGFLTLLFVIVLIITLKSFTSVEYSLNQIALNYKTHKLKKFLEYVDTKSVIANYINRLPNPENNIFGLVYEGIDKQKEVKLYSEQMNKWVEQGYSKDPLVNLQLKSKWVQDSLDYNKSIVYGIDEITYNGDIATIGFKIFHPRYDTTMVLNLNFREKDYHWELYDIPNLNKTINTLDSLESKMYPNQEPKPQNLFSLTHFLL